jgi:hypothetical protein
MSSVMKTGEYASGNAPKGSSSANTGEFWAEMDMMDEINHRGNALVI